MAFFYFQILCVFPCARMCACACMCACMFTCVCVCVHAHERVSVYGGEGMQVVAREVGILP